MVIPATFYNDISAQRRSPLTSTIRGKMESPPNRPRLEARQSNERPHVLIVTDDPGLAEFLAEGLPLGGFWASLIANGLQALEVFRLRQFDLVVLDADLQNFEAIELLRRLRGVSSLDRTGVSRTGAPVVLVHGKPPSAHDAIDPNLDVSAELYPPIELEDVVRTLHDVFASWRRDHPDTPLADSSSFLAR
jgi:CheY-like chemotaxis protein